MGKFKEIFRKVGLSGLLFIPQLALAASNQDVVAENKLWNFILTIVGITIVIISLVFAFGPTLAGIYFGVRFFKKYQQLEERQGDAGMAKYVVPAMAFLGGALLTVVVLAFYATADLPYLNWYKQIIDAIVSHTASLGGGGG